MNPYRTNADEIRRIALTIDGLRTEQAKVTSANSILIAWGIESATEEVIERVHAIEADLQVIAARLHALGADDQAASVTSAVTP
ncbi:hypothetical protein ACFFX1_11880 [Dactylosporangium sucinum]|uniref:Uncharacterized protein n=1 Tax=Dactylosporangium sucinum TaxID=1424081 RepID=A0A917TNQ3_9ACTN|nr:hypothetical protein [Dactylosporangium sucinum]GGM27668.1 hypothetical protein GCM10007977_031140 [Dactylosporangium sucinum]